MTAIPPLASPSRPYISIHTSQPKLTQLQQSALAVLNENITPNTTQPHPQHNHRQSQSDSLASSMQQLAYMESMLNRPVVSAYNPLDYVAPSQPPLRLRRPAPASQSILHQQHTATWAAAAAQKSASAADQAATETVNDVELIDDIDNHEFEQTEHGVYIIRPSRPSSRNGLDMHKPGDTDRQPVIYTIEPRDNVDDGGEDGNDAGADNNIVADTATSTTDTAVSQSTPSAQLPPVDDTRFQLQSVYVHHALASNTTDAIIDSYTTPDTDDTDVNAILPGNEPLCHILYNYIQQHKLITEPVLTPRSARRHAKQLPELYHTAMRQCHSLLTEYTTITACIQHLTAVVDKKFTFDNMNDLINTCLAVQRTDIDDIDDLYHYVQTHAHRMLSVHSAAAQPSEMDRLYNVVGSVHKCIAMIKPYEDKQRHDRFADIIDLIEQSVTSEMTPYCRWTQPPPPPVSVVETVVHSNALGDTYRHHDTIAQIRSLSILQASTVVSVNTVDEMLRAYSCTDCSVLIEKLMWLDRVGYRFDTVPQLCQILTDQCKYRNIPVSKIHTIVEFIDVNRFDLLDDTGVDVRSVEQLSAVIDLLRKHKCDIGMVQQYIARLVHVDITQQVHYGSVAAITEAIDACIKQDKLDAYNAKVAALMNGNDETVYSMKSALRYIDPDIKSVPVSPDAEAHGSIHSHRSVVGQLTGDDTQSLRKIDAAPVQRDHAVVSTVPSSRHTTMQGPLKVNVKGGQAIRLMRPISKPETVISTDDLTASQRAVHDTEAAQQADQHGDTDLVALATDADASAHTTTDATEVIESPAQHASVGDELEEPVSPGRRVSVLNNRRQLQAGDDQPPPQLSHRRTASAVADEKLAADEVQDVVKSIRGRVSSLIIPADDSGQTVVHIEVEPPNSGGNKSSGGRRTGSKGDKKSRTPGAHTRSNSGSSTSSTDSQRLSESFHQRTPKMLINAELVTSGVGSGHGLSSQRSARKSHQHISPLNSTRSARQSDGGPQQAAALNASANMLSAQMRLSSHINVKSDKDEAVLINKQLLASRRSLRNTRRQTNRTVDNHNIFKDVVGTDSGGTGSAKQKPFVSDTVNTAMSSNCTHVTMQVHFRGLLKLGWMVNSYVQIWRVSATKSKMLLATPTCKNTQNPTFDSVELKHDMLLLNKQPPPNLVFKVYDARADGNVYLGEATVSVVQLLDERYVDEQYDVLDVHRLNTDKEYRNSGMMFVTDVVVHSKDAK